MVSTDDAQKSSVNLLSTHAPISVPKEQENKELTKSISGVPANPLKVKPVIKEFPIAQKYKS